MGAHRHGLLLLAISLLTAAPASAAAPDAGTKPPARASVQVTWLGHAAFEVVSPGGTRLLLDPWLKENPRTPPAWKDVARYGRERPTAILVTHSHADHAEDVPALAWTSGAPVVATGEHLRAMKIPEAQQHSVNVGGSFQLGDVTVHVVPAMHSSEAGGRPLGYVLTFADGRSLYHTGDTWLFGDMELIQELYHPDILLLTVGGGRWGLDPKTAALAVRKYFRPTLIIPMHFGTFEPLAEEAEVRAAFAGDPRMRLLTPGQPVSL
ncbi:metal-dependent hydrolase [Vitiosangium sp. GDMCC 1.1324]|uniref:metal-dependent hydrolase n=1 Tax=Vitiosangium sp. (strain GDMCC 1.1324) TaxID=2138576 RepID=UPI000D35B13A|nr:metal-dependent hydrolase [Vitiosangium sp. GDMCC 1.1324]PTL84350.1 metal-dependent hydrolase [Vitiosangium sp. GDMCC 1.1324]